mmetsp:Transcript_602/g.705  ORF Transcript_602/g.705 Transcript_602/m.705 type:complete len:305 (+) Transcript_602:53-967(+)|eukprot:CAMPEP_0195247228 /NCGR_PEP_ID=MMETSP0706-20130129/848_1 /TAXON_ID=33640 /ORGANISM="Asterionellopsis glacialis, Strain CCMP134" /LENGTH=304 /DNA_ID=CAMNT_0040298705 /DNA_START=32 /DNA_END=946 /DNA_ORIENTATION=-
MEKEQKIAQNQKTKTRLLIGLTLFTVAVVTCVNVKITSTSTEAHLHELRGEVNNPPSVVQPVVESTSEQQLETIVDELDAKVRAIKATGVFMEVDKNGLEATKKLQDATRKLLAKRYGPGEPYRVKVELEFQKTIPDFHENGAAGSFVIELAPSSLQPHSIYSFLEIARNWKKGAFHRNAGHVLQVMVQQTPVQHLAFQEYSDEYPHKMGTVGYAGRPSGPAWYVSIKDNTRAHGHGSQQKKNPYEADSCFGTVIEGFEDVVIKRITKMPGKEFINDPKKHVIIKAMTILVPRGGSYFEWTPSI